MNDKRKKVSGISNAIRAIAAAVTGGAPRNGFVAASRASVTSPKPSSAEPRLQTAQDGRRFAIKFLTGIEEGPADDFMAMTYLCGEDENEKWIPNPKGQSELLRKAFDAIYHAASEEARSAFFVIITDQFGTAPHGWLDVSVWANREAKGEVPEVVPTPAATQGRLNQQGGK